MNNAMVDRSITTAQQAIEESIRHDCIAHVCLPIEESDHLGCEADDCVEHHDEPRRTEYWGTTDDGRDWRVMDYAE